MVWKLAFSCASILSHSLPPLSVLCSASTRGQIQAKNPAHWRVRQLSAAPAAEIQSARHQFGRRQFNSSAARSRPLCGTLSKKRARRVKNGLHTAGVKAHTHGLMRPRAVVFMFTLWLYSADRASERARCMNGCIFNAARRPPRDQCRLRKCFYATGASHLSARVHTVGALRFLHPRGPNWGSFRCLASPLPFCCVLRAFFEVARAHNIFTQRRGEQHTHIHARRAQREREREHYLLAHFGLVPAFLCACQEITQTFAPRRESVLWLVNHILYTRSFETSIRYINCT
jgi:hypothetical protein